MANLVAEDQFSPLSMSVAGESFWARSLDPRNEERMPTEFRSWRRWSNRFEKEEDLKLLQFDMGSECNNCGSSNWELIDTAEIKAIQCRACGFSPSESRRSSSRIIDSTLRFSTRCSKALPATYSEDDGSDVSSFMSSSTTPSEAQGISEHDFASSSSSPPRARPRERISGIKSVRQSMVEPLPKPVRWFEANEPVSFQFKLTPRGSRGLSPSSASSASSASTSASSAPSTTSSSSSSSQPSNKRAPGRNPPIRISELSRAEDPTPWQRLLTTALFLMKEEHVPKKDGEPKVLDLGLLDARQHGGKHLAMKHHNTKDFEKVIQSSNEASERILWRVVVKPIKKEKNNLLPR